MPAPLRRLDPAPDYALGAARPARRDRLDDRGVENVGVRDRGRLRCCGRASVLANQRGVGRGDLLGDGVIYLAGMTCVALWQNRAIARTRALVHPSEGAKVFPARKGS